MNQRPESIAIGYTRVSTSEQATEGASLQSQQRRIEAFCRDRELSLAHVYIDAGLSGRKASNRPALQDAMSHVSRVSGERRFLKWKKSMPSNNGAWVTLSHCVFKDDCDLAHVWAACDRLVDRWAEFEREGRLMGLFDGGFARWEAGPFWIAKTEQRCRHRGVLLHMHGVLVGKGAENSRAIKALCGATGAHGESEKSDVMPQLRTLSDLANRIRYASGALRIHFRVHKLLFSFADRRQLALAQNLRKKKIGYEGKNKKPIRPTRFQMLRILAVMAYPGQRITPSNGNPTPSLSLDGPSQFKIIVQPTSFPFGDLNRLAHAQFCTCVCRGGAPSSRFVHGSEDRECPDRRDGLDEAYVWQSWRRWNLGGLIPRKLFAICS